jgi:lipoprotein-anchoring transpeptidase ErfK/SrfK
MREIKSSPKNRHIVDNKAPKYLTSSYLNQRTAIFNALFIVFVTILLIAEISLGSKYLTSADAGNTQNQDQTQIQTQANEEQPVQDENVPAEITQDKASEDVTIVNTNNIDNQRAFSLAESAAATNGQTSRMKDSNIAAGAKWISVNLETSVTVLWTGATPTDFFEISSGKIDTPTPKGTFSVWQKTPVQTMSGYEKDGTPWHYDNVHYATYFYKDYGFHEAYWHNDFGMAKSHGCVNMHLADAEKLYNFVIKGTPVVVY